MASRSPRNMTVCTTDGGPLSNGLLDPIELLDGRSGSAPSPPCVRASADAVRLTRVADDAMEQPPRSRRSVEAGGCSSARAAACGSRRSGSPCADGASDSASRGRCRDAIVLAQEVDDPELAEVDPARQPRSQ